MSMYVGTWKFLKKNFKNLDNIDENVHYFIEATWEGIQIKNIELLVEHNDYLWVSRTVFKKEKIKRVLESVFKNIWKDYDFLFNFWSDNKLVCSELIMKSYIKEWRGDEWIDIKLEEIWWNFTFPPNNFIKILSSESKKKKSKISPIFFIDSIEKKQHNFVENPEKLLETQKRWRLTFFLK